MDIQNELEMAIEYGDLQHIKELWERVDTVTGKPVCKPQIEGFELVEIVEQLGFLMHQCPLASSKVYGNIDGAPAYKNFAGFVYEEGGKYIYSFSAGWFDVDSGGISQVNCLNYSQSVRPKWVAFTKEK